MVSSRPILANEYPVRWEAPGKIRSTACENAERRHRERERRRLGKGLRMNDSAPFDLGEALLKWNRENNLGAADYDRMTARQIAAMHQEAKQVDQAAEIRAALIEANLEGMAFWEADIGFLVRVRDSFPGNQRVFHLTRHLINLESAEVEKMEEEIRQWRAEN